MGLSRRFGPGLLPVDIAVGLYPRVWPRKFDKEVWPKNFAREFGPRVWSRISALSFS